MKSNYDDDLNYQKLVHAVNHLTWEQAKLVIEAVIASYGWKPIWKPVEFDAHMLFILTTIIWWYKPSGEHYEL